jgi:hypothetical protein
MSLSVSQQLGKTQQKSQEMFNRLIKKMNAIPQNIIDGKFDINYDMSNLVDEFKRVLKQTVIEDFEAADEYLMRSRERREYWQAHLSRERSIMTELGNLQYNRHLFKNKETGEYSALVDQMIGVAPNERMTVRLQADILEGIAKDSYRRTGNYVMFEDVLSAPTVEAVLHNTPDLVVNCPEEMRKVRYLYIEADEDHVARQALSEKENKLQDKSFIHLVVIHEGVMTLGQGKERRSVLINKHVISGDYGQRIDELWDEVSAYVYGRYDVDGIQQIFVSGDGAKWIKRGAKEFAGSMYVMDAFHVGQHVTRASLGDDRAERLLNKAVNTLIDFNHSKVKLYFDSMMSGDDLSTREMKILADELAYFRRNWKAITNRHTAGFVGTHMEGQVSHILASRMSTRPMSWSITGGHKEAKLRAFKANGGNVFKYLMTFRKVIEHRKRVEGLDRRVNRIKSPSSAQYMETFKVEVPMTATNVTMSRLVRGL